MKRGNKSGGISQNQSARKFTYLLSEPFPVEEIKLGITRKQVLDFLYKGGNPHSISESLKIARSTTTEHLKRLQKHGLAQKPEGYGTLWQITEKGKFLVEKSVGIPVKSIRVAARQSVKSVKYLHSDFNRGHALQFKLRLPGKWTNEERKQLLEELGIPYKNLNLFGGGQGIEFRGKKAHLTNSSIIIYDSEDHFAISAQKSEDNASIKILYLIKALEREFGKLLSISGKYAIKITKRHHALIKNAIAEIYNKPKRTKLEVYDEKGLWLLIDNSWNLGELECVHSVTGVENAEGMREIMNSFKRTDFKVTSDFVLGNFKETDERIKKLSEQSLQLSQVMEQMNGNIIRLTHIVMKGGGNNAN